MTTISGRDLKKFCHGPFYKATNPSLTHHSMTYILDTLNEDPLPFDPSVVFGNGLYFTNMYFFPTHHGKYGGTSVVDVIVPDDATCVVYDDRIKADKIIVTNHRLTLPKGSTPPTPPVLSDSNSVIKYLHDLYLYQHTCAPKDDTKLKGVSLELLQSICEVAPGLAAVVDTSHLPLDSLIAMSATYSYTLFSPEALPLSQQYQILDHDPLLIFSGLWTPREADCTIVHEGRIITIPYYVLCKLINLAFPSLFKIKSCTPECDMLLFDHYPDVSVKMNHHCPNTWDKLLACSRVHFAQIPLAELNETTLIDHLESGKLAVSRLISSHLTDNIVRAILHMHIKSHNPRFVPYTIYAPFTVTDPQLIRECVEYMHQSREYQILSLLPKGVVSEDEMTTILLTLHSHRHKLKDCLCIMKSSVRWWLHVTPRNVATVLNTEESIDKMRDFAQMSTQKVPNIAPNVLESIVRTNQKLGISVRALESMHISNKETILSVFPNLLCVLSPKNKFEPQLRQAVIDMCLEKCPRLKKVYRPNPPIIDIE